MCLYSSFFRIEYRFIFHPKFEILRRVWLLSLQKGARNWMEDVSAIERYRSDDHKTVKGKTLTLQQTTRNMEHF